MKPATLAIALLAAYLLTRKQTASAAPGAGPINTRAVAEGELTSPQDSAPEGFMYAFDYDSGAWGLVPIP